MDATYPSPYPTHHNPHESPADSGSSGGTALALGVGTLAALGGLAYWILGTPNVAPQKTAGGPGVLGTGRGLQAAPSPLAGHTYRVIVGWVAGAGSNLKQHSVTFNLDGTYLDHGAIQ